MTKPPVAPVEGHYALLRNGIIEKVGELKATLDGHVMFHAVNFNFRWFDSGKSYWDNGQYDIIATISPADMQAVASGELERLRAELGRLQEAIHVKGGSEHAPTMDAYEAADKAVWKHREENERLRAALTKIEDMEYINQLSGNMNFERAQKIARTALQGDAP